MFIKMRLNTPEFENVITSDVRALWEIFKRHNYEIRMAGGAVRDLLLHKIPEDIDFATTATPDQMKTMFTNEGIRLINTKGDKHGTITVRINSVNFEVTTLRIDVITDGRHAEVHFTNDWELDSSRRDLTINSMFLGLDGTVFDYMNGLKDLEMRRVIFVGSPEQRIQEDYLRILRYFRFYGKIAVSSDVHDSQVLTAIRENVHGLTNISGERLWLEFKKILYNNFADSIVELMQELGVLSHIGLPYPNIKEFKLVWTRSRDLKPKVSTLLSALLKNDDDVNIVHQRLKLSNEEKKLCSFILLNRDINPINLKVFKDFIVDGSCKLEDIHELLKYIGSQTLLEEFQSWTVPVFPINGNILLKHGIRKGPSVGETLLKLKTVWKNSNYTASIEELLQEIKDTS